MSKDLILLAREAADELKRSKSVHCISHYDCDGIASAAIVYKALEREEIPVTITFVKELNKKEVEKIKDFKEDLLLFTDIGSGQISLLESLAESKKILISDHHLPEKETKMLQLNPHLVGIDGGENISGAGITYLLMRLMNPENKELLPYALIGAVGDIQMNEDGFLGLNQGFLEDAKQFDFLTVKKGLKIFGRGRKPIPQALSYTTEPYLPGITYNESGAVQFLSELGIKLQEKGKWRTFKDLSFEEEKKIINGLILRGYAAEKLLGDIFILKNGWEISEFASLLNACGRLDKPEIGLKICLENDFKLANLILKEYGRKISQYLNFVEENKNNKEVIRDFGELKVIVGKSNIHENIIGTVTSILQRSNTLKTSVLVGMAYTEDNAIKISGRSSEKALKKGFYMNEVLSELCALCDGRGGGHKLAAGGKIPQQNEEKFIKLLSKVVKRFNFEG